MTKISWTTTTVGSFPRENTPENMEAAFIDQIDNGIEYPCYPQLVSMISQFLDPLCEMDTGLVKKDGKFYLKGELKLPSEPVALEYGQFVLDFFKKFPEKEKMVKGWKACLTGPFTLAGEIIVDSEAVGGKKPIVYQEPRAIMSNDLVSKIAEFMAKIATAYDKMGATIISMDEPTLSLLVGKRKIFFHKADDIIEILNSAIKPISKYSSLHVCGRVAPKLRDILLQSNVKIMDHEFANESNPDVFERSMFEREDKILAYGCLLTNVKQVENGTIKDYVESNKVMNDRIKYAVNKFGKENIILKPDCGFGGLLATFGDKLGSEIVRRKLKVMAETMKRI